MIPMQDYFQEHYVVVNGLRIRYWQAGEAGPNLVLIHGLGGAVEVWRRVLPELARSHRVVALDLPGCGRSQPPVHFPADTLGLFAATVLGLMDALGMATAQVVGSSLGGTVALRTALAAPERVQGLVLVGSAGFTHRVAWPLRLMSVPGAGELLTRPHRDQTAVALRSCVADPATVTEYDVDQAYALATMPGAQEAFLALLRVYCRANGLRRDTLRDLAAGIPTIKAPVLLVWGDRDAIIPFQSTQRARELLPESALVVFAGCGHLAFVEQPVRFARLVESFVCDPAATLAEYRQAPAHSQRNATWGRDLLERSAQRLTPRTLAAGLLSLVLLVVLPGMARQRAGSRAVRQP